ncbi:hypothetical protein HID58_075465 [Brassica napus]|uniref:Uncharacterized protein n=1 Tax=Brassica napus TaxID=3708 RepID=A0ABQ7YJQ7_BRANA|nr:hypothetical protein HID58_075465 [Brassica napus]
MYCCIMHGRLMDQKILDGNTEVAPVATRVHVNGLKEGLRGLFPLPLIVVTSSWRQEKKTRKMHISFCETPSNVSVNDSELESDVSVYDEFDMFYINIVVVGQDDSGKSTDTGHLIDKLHGLGSFRPPSTTALSLLLLILISSRTWLVVPPRMIVLFLSLTPPLVVSKLMNATTPIYSKGKYNEIIREVFSYLKKSTSPSGPQISPSVFHSRIFKGCIGTVPVGRVEPGYGCHLCTLASVLDMIRDRCIKIQKQIK